MNLQRHQKGFTLLEILITMGIIGIIIMVMGFVFIGATKLWLSSDIHMQVQQKAREILSGAPHLKVKKRTEFVTWQGVLNELQDMCILLPANLGTQTLAPNKIRFATEAYIQDGGDGVCNSVPNTILYGTRSISDIQIGTTGVGSIFIIHGEDGKFRSSPNGDDRLYGHIISNAGILMGTPTGTITTTELYIVGDVISYELGSRTITRTVNNTTTTIIGTDISDFSLSYYDAANGMVPDNGTATNLSSVRQIAGTLTVAIAKKVGSAYATYTLPFKVSPRKLDSAFGGM